MRLLDIGLLVVVGGMVTSGCTMGNPAYGMGTEGDAGTGTDAGGTRGDDSTTSGTATDTKGTDSQSGTTGPDTSDSGPVTSSTTTDGTTTDGMTAGTGGSTGMTTGPDPLCPLDEPASIFFKTLYNGSKLTTCGAQAIQINGPVVEVAPGQWTIHDCGDSCDAGCTGGEFLLEYFGPVETAPIMPACASVAVDQHHAVGLDQCEFSGIVIRELFSPNEPPVYVASHQIDYPPTGITMQIEPELQVDPMCECIQDGCCDYTPGLYKLWFPTSESSAKLEEGETSYDELFPGVFGDVAYDLFVARSHAHEQCGAPPHFDWAITRDPVGP